MHNMFNLRVMWRDALTRKGLTVNDLDQATKDMITAYEAKETAYNTKCSTWETAKTTADTLQRELMSERSQITMQDTQINFAIMSIRDAAPAPVPPIVP